MANAHFFQSPKLAGRAFLLFLLFCCGPFSVQSYGQEESCRKVSGAWVFPFKAQRVNGVVLNLWFSDRIACDTVRINGIGLGANVVALSVMPVFIPLSIIPSKVNYGFFEPPKDEPIQIYLNGVNIDVIDFKTRVNGLSISVFNFNRAVNGLSLNAWLCKSTSIRGVTVSPLMNVNRLVRGLQVGLFNKTEDLRGIQIGLWNVNQHRKLPLINWAF